MHTSTGSTNPMRTSGSLLLQSLQITSPHRRQWCCRGYHDNPVKVLKTTSTHPSGDEGELPATDVTFGALQRNSSSGPPSVLRLANALRHPLTFSSACQIGWLRSNREVWSPTIRRPRRVCCSTFVEDEDASAIPIPLATKITCFSRTFTQ